MADLDPDRYRRVSSSRLIQSLTFGEHVGRYHCTNERKITMAINASLYRHGDDRFTYSVNYDGVRTTAASDSDDLVRSRMNFNDATQLPSHGWSRTVVHTGAFFGWGEGRLQ